MVVKPHVVLEEEPIISSYGSTEVPIPNCGSKANCEFIGRVAHWSKSSVVPGCVSTTPPIPSVGVTSGDGRNIA